MTQLRLRRPCFQPVPRKLDLEGATLENIRKEYQDAVKGVGKDVDTRSLSFDGALTFLTLHWVWPVSPSPRRPVSRVMQPAGDASMPAPEADNRDPKTYLAEDRTFLAWIRSGIALMGFGFVVARFGLFLRELEAAQSGSPVETTAFSVFLGTALIVSGVLVTILASFQYMRRIRELQQGVQAACAPSKLALFVAFALSAAGLAMAVYIGTQEAAAHFSSTAGKTIKAIKSGNEIH